MFLLVASCRKGRERISVIFVWGLVTTKFETIEGDSKEVLYNELDTKHDMSGANEGNEESNPDLKYFEKGLIIQLKQEGDSGAIKQEEGSGAIKPDNFDVDSDKHCEVCNFSFINIKARARHISKFRTSIKNIVKVKGTQS